jgi:hypothetical protein
MSRLLAGEPDTSRPLTRTWPGLVEAGQQAQRRGLAAARRAEQGQELAGLDAQVEVVQRPGRAEHPAHADELDGGAAGGRRTDRGSGRGHGGHA